MNRADLRRAEAAGISQRPSYREIEPIYEDENDVSCVVPAKVSAFLGGRNQIERVLLSRGTAG